MTYAGIPFLFYWIYSVVIYIFSPKNFRAILLFVLSVLWVASWKIHWVGVFTGITFFNYILLWFLRNKEGQSRNIGFWSLVLINVSIFGICKIGQIGSFRFTSPFGISFFMFIHMAYMIDLWRSNKTYQMEKFISFMTMPIFFPLLMGGPIIRGKDFFPQFNQLKNIEFQNVIDGILIFSLGFMKFYFLSSELSLFDRHLFFQVNHSALFIPILGIFGTFQAYVDFSSYSDMGRGVAKCFGIDLGINFKALQYSKNPNDYWQRWNIALGTWIRDYISFPLMLRFGRKINQNIMMIISFILVGLWHGLTMNWLVFGLYNGFIIITYNWLSRIKTHPILGKFFVFLIFVGNGLLQRPTIINDLKRIFSHPLRVGLEGFHWQIFRDNLSVSFAIAFVCLMIFEFIQDWRKDTDWYIKLNLPIKTALAIMFLAWIFIGLNLHMFIDEVILPPAYFRI